jgi:phosphoenolpyruvate---glycerone phosphotransferase subunit DhaM
MSNEVSPGIVLVSHSAAIAEGLASLAQEVAGDSVTILPAGGGPEGTLGTNGELIAERIRAADSGAGVVVLVDLGSAILSVKAVMAEGMIDGIDARLIDAPLVEGAVAAAVTASIGADLDGVAAAAEEAWSVRKL